MQALTIQDIPELLVEYKGPRIFDTERQAHPKILGAQWKDGKLVPIFADFGD
jgi:hypothetical protein